MSDYQRETSNHDNGQTYQVQLSPKDLITHFKAALSSRNKDVIKAMWEGNQLLQIAIHSR